MTLHTLHHVSSAGLSLFCFANTLLQNSALEFQIWQQHRFLTVNIIKKAQISTFKTWIYIHAILPIPKENQKYAKSKT